MAREIKRGWVLTGKAFSHLIDALSDGSDDRGEGYVLLLASLTRFFEIRNIANSESAADEVMNRLAKKLEEGPLENPRTYALGIARLVALEEYRSPHQNTSNEVPDIAVAPVQSIAEEPTGTETCFSDCLEKLEKDSREIITEYYRGDGREKIETRTALAEKLKIPKSALRSRAVRTRQKLEKCVRGCIARKIPLTGNS
ncbi:MAG: hypothetical protein R2684_14265 [Pyrinomonadaceae bacterium]